MEKYKTWFYICLSLNLILKCDTKVSIKLLQNQIRVMKESHSLDIKVMQAEIDSLKEKLELIESFINDTNEVKTEYTGKGTTAEIQSQADFVKDLLDGLEKLGAMEKNFEQYAIFLKNGFKSLKIWNKQSLENLELVL